MAKKKVEIKPLNKKDKQYMIDKAYKTLSRYSGIKEAKKFKIKAEKIMDSVSLEKLIHSYGFIIKDY